VSGLADLRHQIDALDAEVIALIGKRFAIVDRVIAVKKQNGMPAFLPDRVETVVRNAVATATASNVPPETIEKIWRLLIAETVKYEARNL
jgi:isochorismate pyruvate lyase